MNIDPLTQDRDDYRSRDEEYHDWCSEHGLDSEADDTRDAYADADWHPMTGKAAPQRSMTATAEGTIQRWHGWAGGGCKGQSAIYQDDKPNIGYHWPVEELLGRKLPHGSRVRITVEVVEESDTPFAPSPWHMKRRLRPEGCTCPIEEPA